MRREAYPPADRETVDESYAFRSTAEQNPALTHLGDVEGAVCGVRFERLADGVRVPCILSPGHECAHAFGEEFEREKKSTGPIVTS